LLWQNVREIQEAFSIPVFQGGNGRMAPWVMQNGQGVKLKDVLESSGIKPGTKDVAFNGLDAPPSCNRS
jgi:DMSO/TMAO reductase YedYZ molybdopterin-dependent catalytic subunit